MTRLLSVILVIVCQIGLSIQTCNECVCCKGNHNCDSKKNCLDGCIDGYYGIKCTEECLDNCKTCVNGYECTECIPGYYTNNCNLQCGKGCLNNTCSYLSGECPCKSTNFIKGKCDACSGGKYGDECNNTCPSNCGSCTSETECSWCKNTAFYGSYCQYRCPVGCDSGKCNKGSGHCIDGCKSVFSGDKCDICSPGLFGTYCDETCSKKCITCISENNCTKCASGYYGNLCADTCPYGCNGNCLLIDGKCLDCKPGFIGEFCDPCEDGTYGVNCSKYCRDIDAYCQVCSTNGLDSFETCTKCYSGFYPVVQFGNNYSICIRCPTYCKDNTCDTAGSCKNGCVLGKWGEMCNIDCKINCIECNQINGKCLKCTKDTFSYDCSQTCSVNCNITENDYICAQDTGKCLFGCKSITNYGEYCEKQCRDSCNNQKCDWKTGHCLEGCDNNYYGLFCDNACSTSCISHTRQRRCDGIKGHCLLGCKNGFHGKRCDNICSSLCVNATCSQTTAECLYGCIDGFKGPKCAEADLEGFYTRSTLIGSTIGTFLAGGIIVGIAALITFIVWRRRNIQTKQLDVHGCVNTIGPCGNRSNDDTHQSDSPVTYEDLKSRDERLYSQIATSQQILPSATEYVNYSS